MSVEKNINVASKIRRKTNEIERRQQTNLIPKLNHLPRNTGSIPMPTQNHEMMIPPKLTGKALLSEDKNSKRTANLKMNLEINFEVQTDSNQVNSYFLKCFSF